MYFMYLYIYIYIYIYPAYVPKRVIKSWKTSYSFNDSKRRRMTLLCSKILTLLRGIKYKHHGGFYCLNFRHYFPTKKN